MKNLTDYIITKRCHLVLEEQDVIKTLNAINRHYRVVPEIRVGNCGWVDDSNQWFIHFTATKAKWKVIRNELKVVRVFDNGEIPKNSVGKVYTTD